MMNNFLSKINVRALVSGLIVLIIGLTITSLDFISNREKSQEVVKDLENELSMINILPESSLVSRRSSTKPHHILVSNSYMTRLNDQSIRTYYDAELKKHGWEFQNEERLRDWGQDFGGFTVNYCKGEYTATLNYAGARAGYDWDYTLALSWGLNKCK
jgi:hypothetical protein